jgi:hypothetical protein
MAPGQKGKKKKPEILAPLFILIVINEKKG